MKVKKINFKKKYWRKNSSEHEFNLLTCQIWYEIGIKKKIKYLKEGPRKKDQSSSNKKTMKKTLNQHVLT
jgi:hypothetical protein